MADRALKELSAKFDSMYSKTGRPSIAPEKLLRALLLQVLYTTRSEGMRMEQWDYHLLFRWFLGLNIDDAIWVPTVFTKNRDRLREGDIAELFFQKVLEQARDRLRSRRASTRQIRQFVVAFQSEARARDFRNIKGIGVPDFDWDRYSLPISREVP